MLGPFVLFFFLLAWLVRYLGHILHKKGKDPASPLLAKLGHVFFAALFLSAMAGAARDKSVGAEAKLARGMGGSTTKSFCRALAQEKTIPLDRLAELARSEDTRMRRNAELVLAYSGDKSSVPILIQALARSERDGQPSRFDYELVNSLQRQTGLTISEASEWQEWLKDPARVEARYAPTDTKEATPKSPTSK